MFLNFKSVVVFLKMIVTLVLSRPLKIIIIVIILIKAQSRRDGPYN